MTRRRGRREPAVLKERSAVARNIERHLDRWLDEHPEQTQISFGKIYGLSSTDISDAITSRYVLPKLPKLLKFAKGFRCSVDALIVGTDADYDAIIQSVRQTDPDEETSALQDSAVLDRTPPPPKVASSGADTLVPGDTTVGQTITAFQDATQKLEAVSQALIDAVGGLAARTKGRHARRKVSVRTPTRRKARG